MVTQPLNYPAPAAHYAQPEVSGKTKDSDSSDSSTGLDGSAPSEQMFLQLLVAQIKNQDPTSPSDPSQFVAQLAQFSQLEQVIAIRQDVDALGQSDAAAAAANSTGKTGTTRSA